MTNQSYPVIISGCDLRRNIEERIEAHYRTKSENIGKLTQPCDFNTLLKVLDDESGQPFIKNYVTFNDVNNLLFRITDRKKEASVNGTPPLAFLENVVTELLSSIPKTQLPPNRLSPGAPTKEKINQIINLIGNQMGTNLKELREKGNAGDISHQRQMMMYLCKEYTGAGWTEIGRIFDRPINVVKYGYLKIAAQKELARTFENEPNHPYDEKIAGLMIDIVTAPAIISSTKINLNEGEKRKPQLLSLAMQEGPVRDYITTRIDKMRLEASNTRQELNTYTEILTRSGFAKTQNIRTFNNTRATHIGSAQTIPYPGLTSSPLLGPA